MHEKQQHALKLMLLIIGAAINLQGENTPHVQGVEDVIRECVPGVANLKAIMHSFPSTVSVISVPTCPG